MNQIDIFLTEFFRNKIFFLGKIKFSSYFSVETCRMFTAHQLLALLFNLNRKLTVLAGANIDQEQLMTAVDPFTL